MHLSNDSLITRIARGDRNAFESLYDRHAPTALGILIRIVGERAAAEDLLQELFWQVWQKAPAYSSHIGSFTNWLFRIVHSLAISVHGQAKASPGEIMANAQPGSDGRPAIIEDLTHEQKRSLEMAYFHGMTRQQIADVTGETLDAIDALARRGLEKLMDGMNAPEGDV